MRRTVWGRPSGNLFLGGWPFSFERIDLIHRVSVFASGMESDALCGGNGDEEAETDDMGAICGLSFRLFCGGGWGLIVVHVEGVSAERGRAGGG